MADITVASALGTLTMEQLFLFVANLLGAIAVGWLWYLQKRGDTRDERCTKDFQRLKDDQHKIENDFNVRLNAVRDQWSKELVDQAQSFVEMYAKTSATFISKDDFHRSIDAVTALLRRIDEKLDNKADKK